MKKVIFYAIVLLSYGCYTPLNNSGVSTTKQWLEVPGKRVDFDGKQYDSCVQFKLRFWPQEAVQRLDLQASCISACCWRSEQDEITLDFNKGFNEELHRHGVARKYSPEKITLKVTHSNLVNVTKVTVNPRSAISRNGLVKLSYKTIRDEARLAEIERELELQEESYQPQEPPVDSPVATRTSTKTKKTTAPKPQQNIGALRAKALVQRNAGAKIDNYFYRMNKTYQAQNAVFLLSSRLLVPKEQEDGTYLVTCHAKARTGIDEKHLNTSDFPCGVWLVDINVQMVLPQDNKAKQIAQ
ncbi:MAG: hypothetical protein IJ876_06455 [Elusimicrobiaceae bacterium]|nr:hypothetical protein [Elusimicrobiaceae bacterium]